MAERMDWDEADERALARLLLGHSITFGVIFIGPEGRVRGWGRGAEHLTGFRAGQVIGQPAAMLFTQQDQARGLPEQELRIAREVGVAEDERWHVRSDGGRSWTSGVTLPLRDATGALTGFVKIFRDATHLGTRIQALENQVEACATQAARHDYFVSSIAHELRNPLGPLKNGLQLLQRQVGGAAGWERPVQVMERQLGFLERLVEDLVDLTRVQTGKLRLAFGEVDLQQLVSDAVDAARQRAQAKGLLLQAVLPAVPLVVEVDGERMQQVLSNLINNAIKFTPAGGHVWASVTADQTHFLVLVKDTGQGIHPDLLARVFDAFTQADDSGARRDAGVGIGLAVVKEIVALHRGTIEVRSEGEGKGAEFIVRIPLRRRCDASQQDRPVAATLDGTLEPPP